MSISKTPDELCDACSHPGSLPTPLRQGLTSVLFLFLTREVRGKTSIQLNGSTGIKSEFIRSPLILRVKDCTVQV